MDVTFSDEDASPRIVFALTDIMYVGKVPDWVQQYFHSNSQVRCTFGTAVSHHTPDQIRRRWTYHRTAES